VVAVLKTPPKTKLAALADARPVVRRLRDLFGLRVVASLLDVDPGNLSRYLGGGRTINAEATRRAIDLDHVLARAAQVFVGSAIIAWLTGHSQAFAGARPIDMLATDGPSPLLDELSRIAEGGYA
jgi:hypothetical protein